MVNCFLTCWAKKSPRFVDEKIFIFENITQMYPRGQSHLERALHTCWVTGACPLPAPRREGPSPGKMVLGGAFCLL